MPSTRKSGAEGGYGLPASVLLGGEDFEIRTDFRVILEILEMLNDAELSDTEKNACALVMFYPEWRALPDGKEALEACFRFIDMGEAGEKRSPRLIDWQQDFPRIIAPVNRVLGMEARAVPYDADTNSGGLHWWTFLAAYMEVGSDCLMAQIVHIRDKQARGKPLDSAERAFVKRNRALVELHQHSTADEDELIKQWL